MPKVKEYVSSSLYLGLFIDIETDFNFTRLGHQIDIMTIFALLTGSVLFNIFILWNIISLIRLLKYNLHERRKFVFFTYLQFLEEKVTQSRGLLNKYIS